jgi:hypothetical protein
MQDRPTAVELVEAVARFLGDEVLPILTDPRMRFRGLIAANVLSVVARELTAGEAPLLSEWQRLVVLLDQPEREPPSRAEELHTAVETLNRELCARIRAGEADVGPWQDAVFTHVQRTVTEKLEITNPRFRQAVEDNIADGSRTGGSQG